jgi:hypothetical protein
VILDHEQAEADRLGIERLKEGVVLGTELPEIISLTDAFAVQGEFEAEAGPFRLTLTVEAEFVGDPQEPEGGHEPG